MDNEQIEYNFDLDDLYGVFMKNKTSYRTGQTVYINGVKQYTLKPNKNYISKDSGEYAKTLDQEIGFLVTHYGLLVCFNIPKKRILWIKDDLPKDSLSIKVNEDNELVLIESHKYIKRIRPYKIVLNFRGEMVSKEIFSPLKKFENRDYDSQVLTNRQNIIYSWLKNQEYLGQSVLRDIYVDYNDIHKDFLENSNYHDLKNRKIKTVKPLKKFKEILLHSWNLIPAEKQKELMQMGIYPK